ncbi:MAG: gliding motility-associated protein GldE [Bacteroidales bacterium]|nr:gliding motility-associated protein GldE [Bacteroidales bacterium]MDD3664415.1 gliding motility-associated protein GldE [Bacteroidales bacterium]
MDNPDLDIFRISTAALTEQFVGLLQPFFPLFLLFLILLLVLANWLAGIEIAFFSLTPSQLNQMKTSSLKADTSIQKLLGKPYRLLASLLLAGSLINSAVVLLVLASMLSLVNYIGGIWSSLTIALALSTLLILSFSELIPGTIYSKNPLKSARKNAMAARVITNLLTPFTSLFINPVRLFERRMNRWGLNISVEEISEAMEMNSQGNDLDDESRMLKGIIRFGDTEAREIMKSRVDVTAVCESFSFETVIKTFVESGYSRVPVYKESIDQITGILYIKDILPFFGNTLPQDWIALARPAFLVPSHKKIGDLLAELREKKIHLAVVVDEYGGTEGIVTLEDILEEIVGDINDETDQETDEVFYETLNERQFRFDGKILINDFCRILDLPDSTFDDIRGEADTLAGLILEVEGRYPSKNEQITIQGITFEVEQVEHRRIKRIKVTKLAE